VCCRQRGREEEDDVLLLGGSRLAARYRTGIPDWALVGWLMGRFGGLRSGKPFPL
jgi:hypothetical protein